MTRPTHVDVERPRGPASTGRVDLAEALYSHTYPPLLHSSKVAYRLFQSAVHLSTLRSWYVRRAMRRLLRSERFAVRPTILDVGCGSGDHLAYAVKHRPDAHGIGIDRAHDAIALCRAHSPESSFTFHRTDVHEATDLPQADVILCITVLQYIRDDLRLLVEMRRALRDGGALLLYVPVRNDRLLPLYDRIVADSTTDYDAAQDLHRIYQPEEVQSLLSEAGFKIERIENAYGAFGKLAFELHSALLHGLAHPRVTPKILAAIAATALSPLIATLMLLDYHLPVSRGNALLIEARPLPAE